MGPVHVCIRRITQQVSNGEEFASPVGVQVTTARQKKRFVVAFLDAQARCCFGRNGAIKNRSPGRARVGASPLSEKTLLAGRLAHRHGSVPTAGSFAPRARVPIGHQGGGPRLRLTTSGSPRRRI